MPLPTGPADTVTIRLANGRHKSVSAVIADRVHGIDSDGDLLIPLGEPGHPARHPDGTIYLIPLTPCCQASGKGSTESATGMTCRGCRKEVDSKYATHSTIAVARDLLGLLVRWECDGQWLTARVGDTGTLPNSWRGEVVDPGNYVGLNADLFAPRTVEPGTWLFNLHTGYLTIVSEPEPSEY